MSYGGAPVNRSPKFSQMLHYLLHVLLHALICVTLAVCADPDQIRLMKQPKPIKRLGSSIWYLRQHVPRRYQLIEPRAQA